MTDEAVNTDLHQFANEAVRLNPGSCTNDNTALNLAKRPDEHIVAQTAFIDVAWNDYLHAFSAPDVTNGNFEQTRIRHMSPPSLQCCGSNRRLTSRPVSMDS